MIILLDPLVDGSGRAKMLFWNLFCNLLPRNSGLSTTECCRNMPASRAHSCSSSRVGPLSDTAYAVALMPCTMPWASQSIAALHYFFKHYTRQLKYL